MAIISKAWPIRKVAIRIPCYNAVMKKLQVKIACVLVFLIGFSLISLRNIPRIISQAAPDFTQIRVSARDFLVFKDPYFDPDLDYVNGYPPLSEIFYIPFTFLPYHEALAIFTYISFCSIVGSVFLSLKIAIKRVPWPAFLLFLGLSFLSFPTKFSLGLGQVNIIVLFLLLLTTFLEFHSPKKSLAAGFSLALAICLKPVFSFFLLFFALNKSWKLVTTCLITVSALMILTTVLWPIGFWISWYKSSIYPISQFTANYLYVYVNQGVFGFLARTASNFYLRIYLTYITTVALIAVSAYFSLKTKATNLSLSFFIIALLLFDRMSWQHHFVWTIFPFTVLVTSAVKEKNIWNLTLLILALFLISWNYVQPSLHPIIFLSHQFYGGIILWCINLYYLIRIQNKTAKISRESPTNKIFKLLNFL